MFRSARNYCSLIILTTFLLLASCESGEEKAKQHLAAGIDLTMKRNLEGALTEFNMAVSYDPEYAEAYFQRANTHYNMYNVDQALTDYDKALELNPEHVDALTNRGNAKFYNGDRDGACEDWKKAEQLGKENLSHKTRFCK